jgi:hypothetical protein
MADAIALSAVAMIACEFSVSAKTGGWLSRGTDIANREIQLMLVTTHQSSLLYDNTGAVWEELLRTVQPGWEEDYYDDAR